MGMTVLNVPQYKRILIGVGQTSNGLWQKGVGEGEEDVLTADCRARTEAAKNRNEYVNKAQ